MRGKYMSVINKNRLAIYTLLSNEKLCQYINNGSLRVLIIGNSKDLITETFKAVFWCCKYPSKKLEITIAAKKADEYLKLATEHTDIIEYAKKDNVTINTKAISGNINTILEENGVEYDFAIVACDDTNYSNQICERLNGKFVSTSINEYYNKNDLLRIAYNINFCYSLTYDDRKSYDAAKEELDKDEYNMNSSLAQAAHIAYRNHYCQELKNKKISEEEITAELAKFEHERWNRYMISGGFSPVTVSELKEFYIKNSSHKDMKNLKHACICEYGKAENVLETNPIIWDEYNSTEKILASDLSELDKVSLICSSIRKEKVNFKTYDYQLVLMSGFCEWYKEKYTTAIVVCSDNCYKDIIIPTTTMPENIILIVPEKSNIDYKKTIGDYLAGRNINTRIKTVSLDYATFNIDNIHDLDTVLKNNNNDESCFSCVSPGVAPNVIAAFALHSYINNYPCLTYSNRKITPVSSELSINHNMDRFSMTTKEFLALNNGVYKNEKEKPFIPYEECMALSDIFFKNTRAKEHSFIKDGKKKRAIIYYTIWAKLVFCVHKANEQIKLGEKVTIDCRHEYNNMQHLNDELKSPATDLFNFLNEKKIIQSLSLDAFPQISFRIVDIDKWKSLLDKSGELFELYVYYKMKYSNLFSDVQTGVEIIYDIERTGEIAKNQPHDNEIDVIAFNGFIPVLVSCKSIVDYNNDSSGNKAIYEIASEARQFNGIPVLAVSRTLSGSEKEDINAGADKLIKRAKVCGVHLLDANILCDETKFNKAMEIIVSENGLVSPEDFN